MDKNRSPSRARGEASFYSTGERLSYSFHLVENSIWPIGTAISILSILLSLVMLFHFSMNVEINKINNIIIIVSIISLIFSINNWFKEIIEEATFRGEHSIKVQNNINIGFSLFVISEILLFFSFFFAYFYNSLIPAIEIGSIWPPLRNRNL